MTEYTVIFTFADNIKKYRKANHLTQERLAEKASCSYQMINFIEQGVRFPRAKLIAKIATALNVELWQLFTCNDF